jgi:two-component system, LuxR family, sensor kinase FixL
MTKKINKKNTSQKKILVVDDENIIHLTLDRIFKKETFVLDHAFSADEALERIHEGFDIILSDIRMPGINGIEFLRKIKQIDPQIEVVIMTGYASMKTALKATRFGAFGYITKPFEDHFQLIKTINQAMNKRIDSIKNETLYNAITSGKIDSVIVEGKSHKITYFNIDQFRLLKHLMSSLNDGLVFFDKDGTIKFSNIKFAQNLNHTFVDIIGKNITDFLVPEDVPAFKHAIVLLEKRSKHTFETKLVSKTNVTNPFLFNGTCLLDSKGNFEGFMLVATDLSSLRDMQDHIELLAGLIDNTTAETIMVYNNKGEIIECNLAAENLFGLKKGILFTKTISSLLSLDTSNQFDIGKTQRIETTITHSKGHLIPVEVSTDFLDSQDHKGLIIIRDISERKRYEKIQLNNQKELERSNKELEDFSRFVAHDLKAPLRHITFQCLKFQDMDYQLSKDALKERSDSIESSASKMKTLIDDLLAYSRLSTTMIPNTSQVDLNTTVSDVIEEFQIDIKNSQTEIKVGKLPTIEGVPVHMHQLFQNIIGNSLKFRQKDINPKIIISGNQNKKGDWEVSINDNGIGFNEDHADRLFKPFERIHKEKRFSGTGVGTSICKKIMKTLNGTISAQSPNPTGSTFILTFPKNKSDLEAIPNKEAILINTTNKFRVLAADDCEYDQKILRKILIELNCYFDVVKNGQEALQKFNTTHYDLILLDYQMPILNGDEVLRQIRQLEQGKKQLTPIVEITEPSINFNLRKCLNNGFNDVIFKPFVLDAIKTLIKKCHTKGFKRLNPPKEIDTPDLSAPPSPLILFIEDTPENQKRYMNILNESGYLCDLASNGKEGCTAYLHKEYDLILMDIDMPILDGLDACKHIRDLEKANIESDKSKKQIPIIAFTKVLMNEDPEIYTHSGMSDFLSKPCTPEMLTNMVSKWLGI